jgi:hypothetical protein
MPEAERSTETKLLEAMLARDLEQRLGKAEILEEYLNAVYFGEGAYGIEAAAETYFRVDASELDLAQSALLAAIIRAPESLAPTREPEAATDPSRRRAPSGWPGGPHRPRGARRGARHRRSRCTSVPPRRRPRSPTSSTSWCAPCSRTHVWAPPRPTGPSASTAGACASTPRCAPTSNGPLARCWRPTSPTRATRRPRSRWWSPPPATSSPRSATAPTRTSSTTCPRRLGDLRARRSRPSCWRRRSPTAGIPRTGSTAARARSRPAGRCATTTAGTTRTPRWSGPRACRSTPPTPGSPSRSAPRGWPARRMRWGCARRSPPTIRRSPSAGARWRSPRWTWPPPTPPSATSAATCRPRP